MRATRRRFAFGVLATTALTTLDWPGVARAQGGAGFSVSGARGPFIKQVAGRRFETGGGGGSLALASDAVNLGRFQAARLRMPQTEAKVAELLAGLDAQWPYAKGRPLQVHILGVDYYNAYSLPDDSIVVAFGLLDDAQSDDEVAFVLAHELGHVRLGHFAHQPDTEQRRAQMASRLGQFFAVAQSLPIGGSAGAALNVANQAGATNDLIHFISNVMVEPAHTRDQEDEADCCGYDLSLAAAFAPDAATAHVFDIIQADQQKRDATVGNLDDQLKHQLSQVISPSSFQSFMNSSAGDMRTGLLEGAARIALGVAASSSGGGNAPPQHRPPEERKRGIAQYSTDAYPQGAPLRDVQRGWLNAVRGTGEFAQGRLVVAAVAEAKRARADGHYAAARVALERAHATAFANAPLVLNEAARLADDMGDAPAADRLFLQANQSPDQTVDGYNDYVRMLYRTGQNERAMQVIREGVGRFDNDQKPFIALMIAVARQEGRQDEVQGYLRSCQAYGNAALTKDCELAAGQSATAEPGPSIPKLPTLPFGLPHF
jgi:Zn-dependent protease with chaperone function